MSELAKQQKFTNREISWLQFNERVLDEARDVDNPLLERLNFLSITASNLDEFFMVRVASLKKLISVDYPTKDIAGLTAQEQFDQINVLTHKLVKRQYTTWNRMLERLLINEKIELLTMEELSAAQQQFIEDYFQSEVYPVLTPMAVDLSRPFPLIANASLNLAVFVKKQGEKVNEQEFATLQIPNILPRVISLPARSKNQQDFILLEEIVRFYLDQFFSGYTVMETACYRIMRDMDIDVAEKDSDDLLQTIEKQLRLKDRRKPIRLEIECTTSKQLRKKLVKSLEVLEGDIYEINGPLDLTFLQALVARIKNHSALRFPPFAPYLNPVFQEESIFDLIKKQDWFLHHPYDSFTPIIEFVKQAAEDEQVLAIKMTLYRVSGDSPIIRYLRKAAEHGKQVTVLVEVKARFDEENNIHWAQELEKSGCHVIYGLVGLKTHCKVLLVVRREEDGIYRYMHMGTGNYNDSTARFYTDMGILTMDMEMGQDATNLFNMLSGYAEPTHFNKYVIAPLYLRDQMKQAIKIETAAAKQGKHARIQMKMNSLSDAEMIELLYQASQAGVKVELLVRGICCLRAQIPSLSENIEVHSIVGRFLEHSRFYYFGSQEKLFLSSADLMPRNLNKRVELMFPVEDEAIKEKVLESFRIMFDDTVKTRIMKENGKYKRIDKRGLALYSAQELFMAHAHEQAIYMSPVEITSQFQPILSEPEVEEENE